MESIAQMYWQVTCKFCIKLRNVLMGIFTAIIAMSESAGRARAARQLATMGYYDEARAIMLGKDKEEK